MGETLLIREELAILSMKDEACDFEGSVGLDLAFDVDASCQERKLLVKDSAAAPITYE